MTSDTNYKVRVKRDMPVHLFVHNVGACICVVSKYKTIKSKESFSSSQKNVLQNGVLRLVFSLRDGIVLLCLWSSL